MTALNTTENVPEVHMGSAAWTGVEREQQETLGHRETRTPPDKKGDDSLGCRPHQSRQMDPQDPSSTHTQKRERKNPDLSPQNQNIISPLAPPPCLFILSERSTEGILNIYPASLNPPRQHLLSQD